MSIPAIEGIAQRHIVADVVELLDALGAEKAVWVGHDWGAPVVWGIAQHHPERCHGVAALCVPYMPSGFAPEIIIPFVDRMVYPEAQFPAGQWDYQLFYRENFATARAGFEANIPGTVKALMRAGTPAGKGKPVAHRFHSGEWWLGRPGKCGAGPSARCRGADRGRQHSYVAALERNGIRSR